MKLSEQLTGFSVLHVRCIHKGTRLPLMSIILLTSTITNPTVLFLTYPRALFVGSLSLHFNSSQDISNGFGLQLGW